MWDHVWRRRAILEFDRLAHQLQYLFPYTFKRPLLDGQILDIIEHVLTREWRINKRSHTKDQGSTHILRRFSSQYIKPVVSQTTVVCLNVPLLPNCRNNPLLRAAPTRPWMPRSYYPDIDSSNCYSTTSRKSVLYRRRTTFTLDAGIQESKSFV